MDRVLISQIVSTLIFALICYGVMERTKREKHMKIMLSCFVLDVALVLFIETGKGAVAKALGFPDGLLGFHIIVSVLTVMIYIWIIFTGFSLYKGGGNKLVHRYLAITFLALRTTNLVTSYML